MMKNIFLLSALLFLSGCPATLNLPMPVESNVQKIFTYDYSIPDTPKKTLFSRARNLFAESYGDSRVVFRVEDESEGLLIGKGLSSWFLLQSYCYTGYNIRFAAKDNKARLQLEVLEGAPPESHCKGWPMPSEDGYKEMVSNFESFSARMDQALRGKGTVDNFKNF